MNWTRIERIRNEWIRIESIRNEGISIDMHDMIYANNLLKNPVTKRLSGKNDPPMEFDVSLVGLPQFVSNLMEKKMKTNVTGWKITISK